MTCSKLVADTLLRELTLTVTPNFNLFCTNSVPFATENKHTANGVFRCLVGLTTGSLQLSTVLL